MSIGSAKKIESTVSAPRKIKPFNKVSGGSGQFVEDIDTTNNVLVKDESDQRDGLSSFLEQQKQEKRPNFQSVTADISTSIEALALTGALENDEEKINHNITSRNINIYNNNQSMIKDEEIERTGRSYLKRFYEKNEPLVDVDEFV